MGSLPARPKGGQYKSAGVGSATAPAQAGWGAGPNQQGGHAGPRPGFGRRTQIEEDRMMVRRQPQPRGPAGRSGRAAALGGQGRDGHGTGPSAQSGPGDRDANRGGPRTSRASGQG